MANLILFPTVKIKQVLTLSGLIFLKVGPARVLRTKLKVIKIFFEVIFAKLNFNFN